LLPFADVFVAFIPVILEIVISTLPVSFIAYPFAYIFVPALVGIDSKTHVPSSFRILGTLGQRATAGLFTLYFLADMRNAMNAIDGKRDIFICKQLAYAFKDNINQAKPTIIASSRRRFRRRDPIRKLLSAAIFPRTRRGDADHGQLPLN
jgi:hypothetical protein